MTIAVLILDFSKVEYTIEALEDDVPVRGNIMCSGDPEYDKQCEDEAIAQLEAGNQWAWCCVKVTATLGPFSGFWLCGGCSYASKEEFMAAGSDLDCLKEEALYDLEANIRNAGALSPDWER